MTTCSDAEVVSDSKGIAESCLASIGSELPDKVVNRIPPVLLEDSERPPSLNAAQERAWEISAKAGELKNEDTQQTTTLRTENARNAARMAAWAMGFVGLVVILQGSGKLHLAESTINVLIGGSFAGVVGLYATVLLGLFTSKK